MPCCRQLSCSFSCSSWGYALGGLLGTVLIDPCNDRSGGREPALSAALQRTRTRRRHAHDPYASLLR